MRSMNVWRNAQALNLSNFRGRPFFDGNLFT
jgi:hypothetical protein